MRVGTLLVQLAVLRHDIKEGILFGRLFKRNKCQKTNLGILHVKMIIHWPKDKINGNVSDYYYT